MMCGGKEKEKRGEGRRKEEKNMERDGEILFLGALRGGGALKR